MGPLAFGTLVPGFVAAYQPRRTWLVAHLGRLSCVQSFCLFPPLRNLDETAHHALHTLRWPTKQQPPGRCHSEGLGNPTPEEKFKQWEGEIGESWPDKFFFPTPMGRAEASFLDAAYQRRSLPECTCRVTASASLLSFSSAVRLPPASRCLAPEESISGRPLPQISVLRGASQDRRLRAASRETPSRPRWWRAPLCAAAGDAGQRRVKVLAEKTCPGGRARGARRLLPASSGSAGRAAGGSGRPPEGADAGAERAALHAAARESCFKGTVSQALLEDVDL